jgi:hypothetical protein
VKIRWARQAADMGRKNPISAALHSVSSALNFFARQDSYADSVCAFKSALRTRGLTDFLYQRVREIIAFAQPNLPA